MAMRYQGHREQWIIQGHFGSTWQNGQYVRTRGAVRREAGLPRSAWTRLQTDYIDLGMIHFVDDGGGFPQSDGGADFLQYAKEQKTKGVIRHIGMSTHNPADGQAGGPERGD